jgi:putative membrane protein
MRFLTKLAFLVLGNALAIYVASRIVPGIELELTFKNLVVAGALLGFVNSVIRPLVKLLSFPIIILTLGLFTVIINTAMLLFVSWLLPTFEINSFGAAFWGMIIISIVNYLISAIIKED